MELSKITIKKIRKLIVFTAFLVVALWKFDVVLDVLKAMWKIIFPFVLGGAIAFVTNVPMSFLEKKIFKKQNKAAEKLARPVSLLLTIVLVVGVIAVVMFGVIPQLTRTMGTLMMSIADFVPEMQRWIREFSHNNQEIMKLVNQLQFNSDQAIKWNKRSWKWCREYDEYDNVGSWFHSQWTGNFFHCIFFCLLCSVSERKAACSSKKSIFCLSSKTKSR